MPAQSEADGGVTYIGPRAFIAGFAIACGVFLALVWGAGRLAGSLEPPTVPLDGQLAARAMPPDRRAAAALSRAPGPSPAPRLPAAPGVTKAVILPARPAAMLANRPYDPPRSSARSSPAHSEPRPAVVQADPVSSTVLIPVRTVPRSRPDEAPVPFGSAPAAPFSSAPAAPFSGDAPVPRPSAPEPRLAEPAPLIVRPPTASEAREPLDP